VKNPRCSVKTSKLAAFPRANGRGCCAQVKDRLGESPRAAVGFPVPPQAVLLLPPAVPAVRSAGASGRPVRLGVRCRAFPLVRAFCPRLWPVSAVLSLSLSLSHSVALGGQEPARGRKGDARDPGWVGRWWGWGEWTGLMSLQACLGRGRPRQAPTFAHVAARSRGWQVGRDQAQLRGTGAHVRPRGGVGAGW
jgi:hypothetical protein